MEKRKLKIIRNKDGHGTMNYKVSLPAKWIKQMNLDKQEYATLIYSNNNIVIKNKEELDMKEIKLEKALVKYDKEGNYDYTIESKVFSFVTDEEAKNYAKNNIEKDVEYYFYESQEDLNNNEHYDVIICNEFKKKLSVKNYKSNATVFLEDENGVSAGSITLDFDGIEFDSKIDFEEYVEEGILSKFAVAKAQLDEESLVDVIDSIYINQQHRIDE